MTASTKVMGTRYTFEITETPSGDGYKVALMIGGSEEESMDISNNSKRSVTEAVEKLLKEASVSVNSFQIELMSKELYEKLTGDTGLVQHQKDMESIQQKQEMTDQFQASIASEFRQTLGKKPVQTTGRPKEAKKPAQKEVNVANQAMNRPEVQDMMSEINQNLGARTPAPTPEVTSTRSASSVPSTGSSMSSPEHIDTRVSSVDIEDLIAELNETKSQLYEDLRRVNLRMEKIDAIVTKLSSLSKKF